MPTVKIEWVEGRTIDQKRRLAQEIAPIVAEIAKTHVERVKVEFRDIPRENIAWAGVLMCDEATGTANTKR